MQIHGNIAGWLLAAYTLVFPGIGWSGQAGESGNGTVESIDASDPTRIYTFIGIGPKYTSYTNGEHMTEARVLGNIGMENDMVLFELGYGGHSGNKVPGGNSAMTNGRLRWFHLFNMDYEIDHGYRGWGTQVDVQLAGSLKGTDGQNMINLTVLPAFGLNKEWSLFVPFGLANSWDKDFKKFNGTGLNLSPLLSYTPEKEWWPGSFLQIWPSYTRFISGDLKGEGGGELVLGVGGEFTPTLLWLFIGQAYFDKNFKSHPRGADTGLTPDWNAFFTVSKYF